MLDVLLARPGGLYVRAGGGAGLVALRLAASGQETLLLGLTGPDPNGLWLGRALAEAGVDLPLPAATSSPTGYVVLHRAAASEDGRGAADRVAYVERGANRLLGPALRSVREDRLFAGAGWLHVSGYALVEPEGVEDVFRVARAARARGVPVSLDPGVPRALAWAGPDRLWELLTLGLEGGPDVFLPSAATAAHLTGGAEARQASVELAARFKWAVVKDGRLGAWLAGEQVRAGPETGAAGGPATGSSRTRTAPPESDPSGAGDVFDAALIARILSGAGLTEAAVGADAVAREYVAACAAGGAPGPGWCRVACQQPPLLVSACLVGVASAYDGRTRGGGDAFGPAPDERLWLPVCPEQAGGLHTPRRPAEIRGPGGGEGVLDGRAGVFDDCGRDVTDAFLKGARLAVELARATGCLEGVLKDGSPSCGVTCIYNGTFGGRQVQGLGVTAAALARLGVRLRRDREQA